MSKSKNWKGCFSILPNCYHSEGIYGLASVRNSAPIVCFYWQVLREKRANAWRLLALDRQTDGCGPSCPSSRSLVFVPGTVNTDHQNWSWCPMPVITPSSDRTSHLRTANKARIFGNCWLASLLWQRLPAHQKLYATVLTQKPNFRYPLICLGLLTVKVMLQMETLWFKYPWCRCYGKPEVPLISLTTSPQVLLKYELRTNQ